MDRAIRQTGRAECVDRGCGDRRGLPRHLNGEVAERAEPLVEVRPTVVVGDMLGQLVWGALGTEVVGVRLNSVVAVVRRRHHDGKQLRSARESSDGPNMTAL